MAKIFTFRTVPERKTQKEGIFPTFILMIKFRKIKSGPLVGISRSSNLVQLYENCKISLHEAGLKKIEELCVAFCIPFYTIRPCYVHYVNSIKEYLSLLNFFPYEFNCIQIWEIWTRLHVSKF